MNDKVYRSALIEMGVTLGAKPSCYMYKILLSELGDCWSPDRNVMMKGIKPGNNIHPMYNDVMTETFIRWKRAKA
jgi:hypothetical protein